MEAPAHEFIEVWTNPYYLVSLKFHQQVSFTQYIWCLKIQLQVTIYLKLYNFKL